MTILSLQARTNPLTRGVPTPRLDPQLKLPQHHKKPKLLKRPTPHKPIQTQTQWVLEGVLSAKAWAISLLITQIESYNSS